MKHIAVLGAGITGVTTAYALSQQGYRVTVFDRHRYPAMETSFANGGQLSASNAEVWNSISTVAKGLKWMLKKDAPLLMNPRPSWHKYSWLAEFVRHIANYRSNTVETTRMAIAARQHLFSIAEKESIDFDLEKRGILHFYRDQASFDIATKANKLLLAGGLERFAVTAEEIKNIEPALQGDFFAGFYTPSDSTGDIHKFTRGLAQACKRHGVSFMQDANVHHIDASEKGVAISWNSASAVAGEPNPDNTLETQAIVVCAGVGSRSIARSLGDRVNIYPVKGYSITVQLDDEESRKRAPYVSLLDEQTKIVTSRLGANRFRVAGTAEYNGENRDIRADRIEPLVRWVRRHFDVDTSGVVPWAGLRPMMPDMMPYVAKGSRPGVFYNTGHGHLGWTLSAATADMLAHLVAQHMPTAVAPSVNAGEPSLAA